MLLTNQCIEKLMAAAMYSNIMYDIRQIARKIIHPQQKLSNCPKSKALLFGIFLCWNRHIWLVNGFGGQTRVYPKLSSLSGGQKMGKGPYRGGRHMTTQPHSHSMQNLAC